MADQTRLEQLPTIDGTLLREWPRPPGAHHSWDRWSAAERQQWLLERTYERVDGGWVVSDDPRHRQVREQVLRAVDVVPTAEGVALLADMIADEIDGGTSVEAHDEPGAAERDQRRSQLRFVIRIVLVILVIAAALLWILGDRGSPDPEEVATPSDRTPVTTLDEAGLDDARRAERDTAENGVGPIEDGPIGTGPADHDPGGDDPVTGPADGAAGIAPTTTMPGHEDYLGIFSDGETGIRLGADGTYTLVMPAGSDEGRFRLTQDDDGQVRLQLLEPGDEFAFRIAMPVALHPGGLWWGTAEDGRLLPHATSLPEAITPGDRVVLDAAGIDDIRMIWRTQYPNLELGRTGTRRAEMELQQVTGGLEFNLATGVVDGELTMAFANSPDDRFVSATGRITMTFEQGTTGRDGRGDSIRGRAMADVTFTGDLLCADEPCDGSYRALVVQDYAVFVRSDGGIRLEFAWTDGHDQVPVAAALDPAAFTELSGWFSAQGVRS